MLKNVRIAVPSTTIGNFRAYLFKWCFTQALLVSLAETLWQFRTGSQGKTCTKVRMKAYRSRQVKEN